MKYFMDWYYDIDIFARKRHRVYHVCIKLPLGTKTIAIFRYKGDAEFFINRKNKGGKPR